MWKPIGSDADLPPLGTAEGEFLDFKFSGYEGKLHDRLELALDVAQFANNLGGTILLGAQEHDSRVTAYVGILSIAQQETRIRDVCIALLSPRVPVHPVRIPVGEGEILSVNVPPSLAFVGVRAPGTDRWQFVVRQADRKAYLSFEEVLSMVPADRRSALMLHGIPEGSRGKIRLDTNTPHDAITWGPFWRLEAIGDHHATLQNVASSVSMQFPLVFIEAVWPSDGYGEYTISAPVYLRRMSEEGGPRIYVTRWPLARA